MFRRTIAAAVVVAFWTLPALLRADLAPPMKRTAGKPGHSVYDAAGKLILQTPDVAPRASAPPKKRK